MLDDAEQDDDLLWIVPPSLPAIICQPGTAPAASERVAVGSTADVRTKQLGSKGESIEEDQVAKARKDRQTRVRISRNWI